MKKIVAKISGIALMLTLSSSVMAQTAGTLSFTFTPTSHSGYQGTKNVLAVWIQSSTGTFIKTKMRYGGQNSTSDHLPTWAVNSGGTAGNCMSANCNIVSATTGATLSSFTTKTLTWDGTDVNGNVVADGTYKVTIESVWNHGTSGGATRSFTFTKGAAADIQNPTADANFTAIGLAWNPTSSASIEENASDLGVKVYPNPSNDGVFTVSFDKASTIKVIDISGNEIYTETLDTQKGSKTIDLTTYSNGIYFISVSEGTRTHKEKVVISKK